MDKEIVIVLLTLVISSLIVVTTTEVNEFSERPLNYSCVEDLPSSAFGEIRKRYKISDECGDEFFCIMTCIPFSYDTVLATKDENEFGIKLSIGAKFLNKLHITKTENEIKIDLNTEIPSISVVTEVPTTITTTFAPTIESSTETTTTLSSPSVPSSSPKSPCPCVSPHSNLNRTTTATTTTTTTPPSTTTPRMPCPCVPISHTTTSTTSSPHTTTSNVIETTQELTFRRSSVFETPISAQAIAETTTVEQEYNCTTDATSETS